MNRSIGALVLSMVAGSLVRPVVARQQAVSDRPNRAASSGSTDAGGTDSVLIT